MQNIAGYKFTSLNELSALRSALLAECQLAELKGTILLSSEGININVAGLPANIALFCHYLKTDARLADISFKTSYSRSQPFKRMKVKIKKEIITMRCPEIHPQISRAPSLSPSQFKQWLDEKRDMLILDTRNHYEVSEGTFSGAVSLQLDDFTHFPAAAKKALPQNKPIVMFCTGGIRCEKAALHLLKEGFPEVYQLEGGILNYFAEVGSVHYQGACFVFDERGSVTPESLSN